MLALVERRRQLYRLIGITGITIVVIALLFARLPSDVDISYDPWYTIMGATLAVCSLFVYAPRWLTAWRSTFWLVVLLLCPALESLMVYYSGGARSPFFVVFYFSLFFTGMVGGARGAFVGSLVSGGAYLLASMLGQDVFHGEASVLWMVARLASFYGIAWFAAILGGIAAIHAEDASRRATRIVALNEVNSTLGGILDISALFERIPLELCRRFGFERAVFFKLEGENLLPVAGHSEHTADYMESLLASLREMQLTINAPGIMAEAVKRGVPAICRDTSKDDRVNPSIHRVMQGRSFVAVPLAGKDEVYGVIVADYYLSGRVVSEEELSLLRTFGSLASLAITNCKLAVQASRVEAFRQLDRLKTEFLTSISHELRTPLTVIRGSVDLVLEDAPGNLDHTQLRLLETVRSNSERLGFFLQEILDISQLEEGKVQLRRQPVDMCELVSSSVQCLYMLISHKDQKLCLDLPDGPCIAEVDANRLQPVITNLVINAHKYIPTGGRIWVSLAVTDTECVIEVRDNGPGIPPQHLNHLFEKFYRGYEGSESISGSGLGLAISRAIVELHGGSITVSSVLGEGSAFRVTLPVWASRSPFEYQSPEELGGFQP